LQSEINVRDFIQQNYTPYDGDGSFLLAGSDNAPTLKFARRLASRGRPIWVRHVLVPGWTDDPSQVESVARFAAPSPRTWIRAATRAGALGGLPAVVASCAAWNMFLRTILVVPLGPNKR